jgi:hypothetical protein
MAVQILPGDAPVEDRRADHVPAVVNVPPPGLPPTFADPARASAVHRTRGRSLEQFIHNLMLALGVWHV